MSGAADLNELFKAYVKAYAEFPNAVKDATNPHFGNDYASLEAVLDAVKPVLKRYDLALYQAPGPMGEVAGTAMASVVSVLAHSSGQSLSITTHMPVQPQVDKKSGATRLTAPSVGSAIAYARRYALNSICGITQVDDDGSAAADLGSSKGAVGNDRDDRGALLTGIEGAADLPALEEFKSAVMELGDQAVAKAYREKKKALKPAKGKEE